MTNSLRILVMTILTWVCFICLVLFIGGCQQREAIKEDMFRARVPFVDISTVAVDSCEYIVARADNSGGVSIIHKENCRFCRERGKQ